MIKILYATKNHGKALEVKKYFRDLTIELVTLSDLGIEEESPETGSTLQENALQKLRFYQKLAPDYVIMSDDTGLEIDAMGGRPGVHSRRPKDGITKMTDEQAIDYILEEMKDVPKEKRLAQFHCVIALGFPHSSKVEIFDGELKGEILEKIDESTPTIDGIPYIRIFYVPEWGMTLGHLHNLDPKELEKYQSHRNKAVTKVKQFLSKNTDENG